MEKIRRGFAGKHCARLCSPTAARLPYRTRIVRVVSAARGQPAMTGSLGTAGRTFPSAVEWAGLHDPGAQLF